MEHLGTEKIETERLILRRFALEDADCMYENWASDDAVTKFLVWPAHTSVDVTKRVLSGWIDGYQNKNKYEWCIELKESGEPIGSIGVAGINEKIWSAEIGYCIGRKFWHRGIATEALAAVMKFLIDEVGFRRIECRHDVKNPYSGEVMKKCGLKYEGTKIQGDWDNSGICDCAFYGYVQADKDGIGSPEKKQSASVGKEKNIISDETIAYVGILAKLELSEEEKEQAKKDMGEMLSYIGKLNELDTTGAEPMSHVFPVSNVFREDVVCNGDGRRTTLANAPEQKNGGFKVPKTIG